MGIVAACGPSRARARICRRGLLEAARQTSGGGDEDQTRTVAWVVTGGTDAGVMADVGKIIMRDLTDLDVVCIGVVQKKLVLRHEDLTKQEPKTTYPYPSKETCPSQRSSSVWSRTTPTSCWWTATRKRRYTSALSCRTCSAGT